MCHASIAQHKILGKRLNQSQGLNPKHKFGITTTIVKCNNCDLIASNPQPVPFDLQDHYGIPPEDYWRPEYFNIDDGYFIHEIGRLKALMSIENGMKALDIGAGLGKAMIALNRAGFDTYGFEPSKPFYERAIERMKIDAQKLKLGMIEELEYDENQFDFITFSVVLEHLYNPSEAILKALKWLKPGGLMHIEVPSAHWLVNKLINFIYRLKFTDYVGNLSPMHEPFHLHEFGLKSFQLHAKQHQYDIAFYEYFVCKTYMPKVVDVFIKPYMKYTNTGMQLSIWLKKK